jgi:RNA polymerase sigma factor (sigma-70 family)
MVASASRGDREAREAFVRRYWPVVHGYLATRWQRSRLREEIDDASQEVFLDCFKARGALERVERGQASGFRGFLYGVARHVALRAERKARRGRPVEEEVGADEELEEGQLDDESPSRSFDREWARSVLKSAADRQEAAAARRGPEALRRVELLRLRFHEGRPIREIAESWSVDAAVLHREFARARDEFRAALETEVAFHLPGAEGEVERECQRLLDLLE